MPFCYAYLAAVLTNGKTSTQCKIKCKTEMKHWYNILFPVYNANGTGTFYVRYCT